MNFKKLLKSTAKSTALVSSILFVSQASAWEWTMDFNKYYDGNGVEQSVKMGDILSDQYSSGYVYDEQSGQVVNVGVGATVSADNYNSSADPDFAVALNTSVAANTDDGGRRHFDGDLVGPFTLKDGSEPYSPNNIVILQEDKWQNYNVGSSTVNVNPENTCFVDNDPSKASKGYCTYVDDQGGTHTVAQSVYDNLGFVVPDEVKNNNANKAGHILIDLTDNVTLKSINFFDIAGDGDLQDMHNDELTYVVTYDADNKEIETVQVPGMGEGSASDNKWAKVNFSAADTVRRIFISLGGSGGFSDIKLAKVAAEVAEPGMLAMFMLAIGGLVARNRKSVATAA